MVYETYTYLIDYLMLSNDVVPYDLLCLFCQAFRPIKDYLYLDYPYSDYPLFADFRFARSAAVPSAPSDPSTFETCAYVYNHRWKYNTNKIITTPNNNPHQKKLNVILYIGQNLCPCSFMYFQLLLAIVGGEHENSFIFGS